MSPLRLNFGGYSLVDSRRLGIGGLFVVTKILVLWEDLQQIKELCFQIEGCYILSWVSNRERGLWKFNGWILVESCNVFSLAFHAQLTM